MFCLTQQRNGGLCFFSRKLEAFMAVVENGSLSKAARVMNRTTPPVAKSIKDFEAVLGKRLFKGKVWYEFNARRVRTL